MIWYLGDVPAQKNQQCAVPLGIQGENGVLVYTADVSDWLERWPTGVVALVLQAPDRSDPYIANTALDRETGIITWTVTNFDTAIVGYGFGELRLVDDEIVKKSYRFATYTKASVDAAAAEPPAPTPEWIAEMLEVASGIESVVIQSEAARDAAIAAKEAAETAQAGAETAQGKAEAAQAAAEASEANAAASEANAAASAEAAETSADRAEQAAQEAGYMDFYIDDDGHLIYQRTDNVEHVDFELQDGRLIALWL